MDLVASPTELSTAATDAVLAAEVLAVAAWMARTRGAARWRALLWSTTLGLLAAACLLGAAAHGLAMPESTRAALWRPIYALLGLVVGLMLAAALADLRGAASLRVLLPAVAAIALGFVALSEATDGAYRVFVLFQGGAALATLAVYAGLAWRRTLGGAGTIAAGLALSLAAGVVQASDLALVLIVPFDHNGLYHLVTMVAVALLGQGVLAGQRAGRAPRQRR